MFGFSEENHIKPRSFPSFERLFNFASQNSIEGQWRCHLSLLAFRLGQGQVLLIGYLCVVMQRAILSKLQPTIVVVPQAGMPHNATWALPLTDFTGVVAEYTLMLSVKINKLEVLTQIGLDLLTPRAAKVSSMQVRNLTGYPGGRVERTMIIQVGVSSSG